MAIDSAISFTTKFNFIPSSARFNLNDVTDYTSEGIALANVKGNFKIVDPFGQVVYENTSWVTPDITGNVSLSFNNAPIPASTNGYWSVFYTIQVSGGVQSGTYSKEVQYNFTYREPVVKIYQDGNPITELFKSSDQTDYLVDGVNPAINRTHTVIYPPQTGLTDFVTTSAYAGIGYPNFAVGVWKTEVESELNYIFPTYNVGDKVSGSKETNVQPAPNIQDVLCCLEKLNSQVSLSGSSELMERFEYASSLLTNAVQCLNYGRLSQANKYITQIYDITGCTPNCNCGSYEETRSVQYYGTSNPVLPPQVPIGVVLEYGGEDLPEDFVWANGGLLLQSAYPLLYAVLGIRFNIGGEPSGYFRVPSRNGRVGAGSNPMGGVTDVSLPLKTIADQYGAVSVSYTPMGTVSQASVSGITATSGAISIANLTVSQATATSSPISIASLGATLAPIIITGLTATCDTISIANLTSNVTLDNGAITGTGNATVTGVSCIDVPLEAGASAIDCTSNLVVSVSDIASGLESDVTVSSATIGGSIPTPIITIGGSIPTPAISITGSIPTPTITVSSQTVGGSIPSPAINVGGSIPMQTFSGTPATISVLQPTITMNYIIRYQ